MPPRHAYWTIILEGKPTAFRAHTREELLPTFKQLQAQHPDVADDVVRARPAVGVAGRRAATAGTARPAAASARGLRGAPAASTRIRASDSRSRATRSAGASPNDCTAADQTTSGRRRRRGGIRAARGGDAAAGARARPARVRTATERRPRVVDRTSRGRRRRRSARLVRAARAPGRRLASIVRSGRASASRTRIGRAAKGVRLAIGRGHRARSRSGSWRSTIGSAAWRRRRGGWDEKPWDRSRGQRATAVPPARDPRGRAAKAGTPRAPIASGSRLRIGHAAKADHPAIGRGRRARSRLAIAAIGRPDRRGGPAAGGRRSPGTRSRGRRPRMAVTIARCRRQTLRPTREGGGAPRADRERKPVSDRPRGEGRPSGDRPWSPRPKPFGHRPSGPPGAAAPVRAVVGKEAVGQSRDRQVRAMVAIVGLRPGPRGRGTAAARRTADRDRKPLSDRPRGEGRRPAIGRGRRARSRLAIAPRLVRASRGIGPSGSRPPGGGGRPQVPDRAVGPARQGRARVGGR